MNLLPTQPNDTNAAANRTALIEQPTFSPSIPDSPGLPGSYNSYDQYGDDEVGFNLREFAQKIWRRKWLVLTIVSLVTFFSALQSLRAKNVYEARSTVEIQPDIPTVVRPTGYYYQSEEYELKTAVFLLTSQPLLEDVVVNLKLDNNPAFIGAGGEKSLWQVFRERFLKAEAPAEPVNPAGNDAEVLKLDLRERSPEERALLASAVGTVAGGTSIRQERGTRLIHIFYRHTNQELAALVANGIARTFIERVFRKKTQKFDAASDWLDKSTRDLESQMQQADQALADYTRRNNIFAQDAKDDLSATKLAHLHGELMKAETDRLLKQSLYEEVKQGRVAQLPEAFSNVTTADLQKKLSELTVQSAQLSVKFGARNPKVIEIQQQMEALRKEINESRSTLEEKLKADYERAVREENSMHAALAKAKAEAVQQNQTLIEYNVLKQKVETSKQLYTSFLQKTRQAEVEKAEQARNVSLAQPAAVPTGPVGPPRRRAIMIAFLMSLAASIGLVLLLDHIDNRIKTLKDVGQYLRLPTLGVIPAIANSATKSLNQQNKSMKAVSDGESNGNSGSLTKLATISEFDVRAAHAIAESYRMLRTSVLLAAAGRPPRTILFTSSQPSEGKTTTTVNTAICLAQLGAKVLIIDGDMRRPRIHKIFQVKARFGLSTYLSNDVDHNQLIQPTGIPNLSVMPSGIIPPSAGDLLASEKMSKLLSLLATQFDHVLIDSPPVINVADPAILARHVDGVILVIRSNRCSRDVARHARTELVNAGAKILGVVLNNVDVQDLGYDYYYQRYYGSYAGSSAAAASASRESGRLNGVREA